MFFFGLKVLLDRLELRSTKKTAGDNGAVVEVFVPVGGGAGGVKRNQRCRTRPKQSNQFDIDNYYYLGATETLSPHYSFEKLQDYTVTVTVQELFAIELG